MTQLLWSQMQIEMRSWLTTKNGRYSIADEQMQIAVFRCFKADYDAIDKVREEIFDAYLDSEKMGHGISFADYDSRIKQFRYHDSYRYKIEIAYQLYKLKDWETLKELVVNPDVFEVLYRSNRPLLVRSWEALMKKAVPESPAVYADTSFDEIDPYLAPVIANDMATLLNAVFHDSNAAMAVMKRLTASKKNNKIPPIAQSVLMMNNGCRHAKAKQYEEACACFVEALEMQRSLKPTPHKEIARTSTNLGYTYYEMEKYGPAKEQFESAFGYYSGQKGTDNRAKAADMLYEIGMCCYMLDENEAAVETFDRTLSLYAALEGKVSKNVAATLYIKGKTFHYMNRHEESRDTVTEALELATKLKQEKLATKCREFLEELRKYIQ
jgi:tetratricopeptide (TPR) repeat protein